MHRYFKLRSSSTKPGRNVCDLSRGNLFFSVPRSTAFGRTRRYRLRTHSIGLSLLSSNRSLLFINVYSASLFRSAYFPRARSGLRTVLLFWTKRCAARLAQTGPSHSLVSCVRALNRSLACFKGSRNLVVDIIVRVPPARRLGSNATSLARW